ncbi:hypothetical protein QU487_22245 [Crenobacter sp. SG2305]|uniref:hypothetical protein n=1 Tax=Crenobacter oryzisoli TaxID=3056844 RepID=UPI0025AA4616|nr:hypothetical protein [Crenobacter sp. SG2305]MDN0085424.1 hypothetical protein [Crenobacter sp. SG2305]
MLTNNALHLAERDGQLAALRVLYGLRWHLDAHDNEQATAQASCAFLDGFVNVFADCIGQVWPNAVDGEYLTDAAVDRLAHLFEAITERTPALIAQLDR